MLPLAVCRDAGREIKAPRVPSPEQSRSLVSVLQRLGLCSDDLAASFGTIAAHGSQLVISERSAYGILTVHWPRSNGAFHNGCTWRRVWTWPECCPSRSNFQPSSTLIGTAPAQCASHADTMDDKDDVGLVPTTGDIARRGALLFPLEHVHRETIGVNLTIHVGPKAIHLIALDIFDGHQCPS
jgi:hypothetical protein